MPPRRDSVGRLKAGQQSASGEPTVKMVSVAVLPPRLRPGMAPPTGIGAAEAFSWDEAINWQHNDRLTDASEAPRKKSFLQKAGLTRERTKQNPDLPPFVLRQIPYDTWRKHYAKDKDGNYRGTHAPAEDCLLRPDDVAKWRLGGPTTKADLWTRGKEALPVYNEHQHTASLPEYGDIAEPVVASDDDHEQVVRHFDRQRDSIPEEEHGPTPRRTDSAISMPAQIPNPPAMGGPRRETIANGKTAPEIIAEAKAKHEAEGKQKTSWKKTLSSGFKMTMGA